MACFVTGFLGKGEAGRGEQKTASRGGAPALRAGKMLLGLFYTYDRGYTIELSRIVHFHLGMGMWGARGSGFPRFMAAPCKIDNFYRNMSISSACARSITRLRLGAFGMHSS